MKYTYKAMFASLVMSLQLSASAPGPVSLESIFSKEVLAIMPETIKKSYTEQIGKIDGDSAYIKIKMKDAIQTWEQKLAQKQIAVLESVL